MNALPILFCLILCGSPARAYPIDGYEQTGIRRLERARLVAEGRAAGPALTSGALKPASEIRLHLSDTLALESLPARDPALQKRLEALFPDRHESYSVALLDITPGRPVRYAAYQEGRAFSPGSVGKLAIAAGLFAELKSLFPDDPEKRRELLRTRTVVAGRWVLGDHHEVPIYTPEDSSFASRPIREGDAFSLYEWADHMLSASANAAASTLWKEAMLMRAFGKDYPPSPEAEAAYFKNTPKPALSAVALSVVNGPLQEAGVQERDWRLGSFFTKTGQQAVPGGGGSHGNPRVLLLFLLLPFTRAKRGASG